MILNENQRIQITAILMEASNERGDKQGFLAKAKDFLKRLLAIVKEKISKFKSFLKEKVKSLIDRITIFIRARKGGGATIDKMIASATVARENSFTEYAKTSYKNFKTSDDRIKKIIPKINDMLKDLKRALEEPEYEFSAVKFESAIFAINDNISDMLHYTTQLSKSDTVYKIQHSQESKDAINRVDKLVKDMISVVKGYKESTDLFLGSLEYNQKLIGLAYKELDKLGDSKIMTALSKTHSTISKLGSAITSIWSKIFSFVASLIGRKKKED